MSIKKIKLSMKDLHQSYGNTPILKGISLDVYEGEILVILGSSGCGKTSLLKSIAGLVPLDSGQLLLDGRNVEDLPPQSRKTVMIFQNYALFPHMNVRENLEYGLKVKGRKRENWEEQFAATLHLLKLEGLENRPVTELSGGQQQRVAIGRAMIIEPAVLLFDEPLSNLDENLRKQMRKEIRNILRQSNITSIYVTHDQNEALAIADRIVVMREGQIEQIALPSELHYKPDSEYVARFLGYNNIFPGEFSKNNLSLFKMNFPLDEIHEEGTFPVLIRPEDLGISRDENAEGTLSGIVSDIEIQSSVRRYRVNTPFGEFDVSLLNKRDVTPLSIGDLVYLELKRESLHFLRSVV
ncbi:ABC transporter ATP-binding protein [uncultured Sphaerochaeta sp.]|uniref:ABC transporter ATP-binding protein n=1 Tax=uncultured Sphaerochaeta sp. TaxID=886478 RepID=UPI002A0A41B6|nr:ABC transporter ATP-binding protein [uncultured Sphaerochaeta sp.]